jgi:uncharacterized membrane protein
MLRIERFDHWGWRVEDADDPGQVADQTLHFDTLVRGSGPRQIKLVCATADDETSIMPYINGRVEISYAE